MTRCLDEAKLQSYFDGELSLEMMESVTSHLASCVTCAAAARELEEESALLMTALAPEFEANVPTERLRQRIDEAVLGERVAIARSSSEKTSGFFAGLLNFGTQRTLGYASLAVVLAFGAIVAVVKMRTPDPVASTTPQQQPANVEIAKAPISGETGTRPAPIEVTASVKSNKENKVSYRPAKSTANSAPKAAPARVKLLPGESTYLQTIARLDSTIKSNKGMRPALQVEYERNLAVVDRAIAATRSAAKSNPSDPDAADFMFAAYQSKVDLLNTIADARLGGGPRH